MASIYTLSALLKELCLLPGLAGGPGPCVYVGGGKKYPFLLLLMVNIIRQLTVKRGDMAG